MKSTLMACFTGVCLLGTVYIAYKVYNFTSVLSEITAQTSALNERMLETQADTRKNSQDIQTVGKLIEEDRAGNGKIRVPEPWEDVPKSLDATKPQVKNAKTNSRSTDNRSPSSQEKQLANSNTYDRAGAAHPAGSTSGPDRRADHGPDRNESAASFAAAGSSASNSNTSMTVLKDRMKQLKNYAQKFSLDKEYALIADMGVNAGKKRFYIVNLSKMAVTRSGLMAYDKKSSDNSNTHIYRIEKTGREYYELYSLDNNGEIMSPEPEILSPVSCIPNEETGSFACESEIGPALSPEFFGEVQQLIKLRKNPLILWMFK